VRKFVPTRKSAALAGLWSEVGFLIHLSLQHQSAISDTARGWIELACAITFGILPVWFFVIGFGKPYYGFRDLFTKAPWVAFWRAVIRLACWFFTGAAADMVRLLAMIAISKG